MELQLNQWREQMKIKSEQQAKLPAGLFQSHDHHHSSSPLSLFAPDGCTKLSTTTTTTTTTTNLSAHSTSSATALTRMGGGSSYFSMGQLQDLELQALIFRHIISGATVPPQLIHLLLSNKSFILSSLSPPYYQYQLPLQHYHPAWMQSWGKGDMDPEPDRCRRTDGKKWRCSKDVVAGHKYCDRHVHRGRNRSRKPVENHTHTPSARANNAALVTNSNDNGNGNGNGGGGLLKWNTIPQIAAQPLTFGSTNFTLSGPSNSSDLLHFNQRSAESVCEIKGLLRIHNDSSELDRSDSQTLCNFFDDWPRTIQEPRNTINNASIGTSLSISVPGIYPNSDVSLKLSTGIRDEPESGSGEENGERERSQLHWGTTWGGNQMGGPLAEALRSSTSTSSPTSVLHQLHAST